MIFVSVVILQRPANGFRNHFILGRCFIIGTTGRWLLTLITSSTSAWLRGGITSASTTKATHTSGHLWHLTTILLHHGLHLLHHLWISHHLTELTSHGRVRRKLLHML
jgi:hypothetical protein